MPTTLSINGAKQSHHQITRVGAVLEYECGKCRKQFFTFEVCVPNGEDPYEIYNTVANAFGAKLEKE